MSPSTSGDAKALIDAGERPGLKSYEADPLLAARRRKFQVVRGLNNLGYSERYACQIVG